LTRQLAAGRIRLVIGKRRSLTGSIVIPWQRPLTEQTVPESSPSRRYVSEPNKRRGAGGIHVLYNGEFLDLFQVLVFATTYKTCYIFQIPLVRYSHHLKIKINAHFEKSNIFFKKRPEGSRQGRLKELRPRVAPTWAARVETLASAAPPSLPAPLLLRRRLSTLPARPRGHWDGNGGALLPGGVVAS
jgi:hypothetical protein